MRRALLFLTLLASCGRGQEGEGPFAGAARCASCHAAESRAWRGSQHAAAMQEATPATVLGRFAGDSLVHDGVTTTFARRGDRYVVRTEGERGTLEEFEVRYTFGVAPLQQYLVALPRGRLQTLPYAWDSRPRASGGERWFSLDPAPRPAPGTEGHWAGRHANWNYMCADCHSTAVRKGYDAAADSFATTWSAIDVSCEGCHGPSARHAEWAGQPRWWRRMRGSRERTPNRLGERRGIRWTMTATGTAMRSAPRATDREVETCAQCHALRTHVADGYVAGAPFLDFYDPTLLVRGSFHPDGQQMGFMEVFNYASFLQSRMYAAGVTCSDCHEPHGGKLRAPGDAVCARCHAPQRYERTSHHRHLRGSAGARCVACHMPDTLYMEIDRRHDHSMRVPRPDLTVRLGVPNACDRCHADRGAAWSAAQVRGWLGRDARAFQRFAGAFAADDAGDPRAADSLARIAGDASHPPIVRASALSRLVAHPGAPALDAARRGVRDPSPLVRRGALDALEGLHPRDRAAAGVPLLRDSLRMVRIRAAWVLAPVGDSLPDPGARAAFVRAAAEFVASQQYNGDRATSQLNLGAFHAARGQLDSSAAASRAAIRIAPYEPQGYLNLAAVLLERGEFAEALRVLEAGVRAVPGDEELRRGAEAVRRSAGR